MSNSPARPVPFQEVCFFVICVCFGAIFGALTGTDSVNRCLRAVYYGAMFGFMVVAFTDLIEHVRLEKELTGSYFSTKAIPVGESVLHLGIIGVVVSFLWLARPLMMIFTWRDWYLLVAPGLLLLFGWMDELIYHQMRTKQRENILHTLNHLAVAAMLVSCVLLRMVKG